MLGFACHNRQVSFGKGTVFFTGCPLGCKYCQNAEIALRADYHRFAAPEAGEKSAAAADTACVEVSPQQLARIFLNLQDQGAVNINLVTAGHFIFSVKEALIIAKREGLSIPVVYNSSGYEKPDTLRMLEGLVDIYLPDFKYMSPDLAQQYSRAKDYPVWAKRALQEMLRQTGTPVFDANGIMQKGVIVRVLLLPGHVKEACSIVDYLHTVYGDDIFISLLSQYTPMPAMKDDPLLRRRVTKREYEKVVQHALEIGVVNGFVQEGEAAKESFIPSFRGEGVLEICNL